MALASGKLTGMGLGHGTQTQTSNALTGKHTDFIFAVIGEELGLIACVIVLLLLTAIIIRCCVIGIRSGGNFGMLICFGVGAGHSIPDLHQRGHVYGHHAGHRHHASVLQLRRLVHVYAVRRHGARVGSPIPTTAQKIQHTVLKN